MTFFVCKRTGWSVIVIRFCLSFWIVANEIHIEYWCKMTFIKYLINYTEIFSTLSCRSCSDKVAASPLPWSPQKTTFPWWAQPAQAENGTWLLSFWLLCWGGGRTGRGSTLSVIWRATLCSSLSMEMTSFRLAWLLRMFLLICLRMTRLVPGFSAARPPSSRLCWCLLKGWPSVTEIRRRGRRRMVMMEVVVFMAGERLGLVLVADLHLSLIFIAGRKLSVVLHCTSRTLL